MTSKKDESLGSSPVLPRKSIVYPPKDLMLKVLNLDSRRPYEPGDFYPRSKDMIVHPADQDLWNAFHGIPKGYHSKGRGE